VVGLKTKQEIHRAGGQAILVLAAIAAQAETFQFDAASVTSLTVGTSNVVIVLVR
jgi:hypothetical protein